jgi:DNA-binding FadR family transcriptional regulator
MRSGQFSEAPEAPPASPRRFVSVASGLLDSIATKQYLPGDRLPPDRTLAADLGVSRATVREAQLALELLGVVEIRHGSGVYVRDPATVAGGGIDYAKFQPSTQALFEARAAVEPAIVELCAVRMSPEAIARVSASITGARAAVRSKAHYPEFAAQQLDFHLQLAAGCDSAVLADLARRLVSVDKHPLWALLNQHALRTQAQRLAQVAEHAAILKEIKAGNAAAAATAMRRHLSDLGAVLTGSPTG